MAGKTLENMEKVWDKSRGHYHYPALNKPRAAEIPNGGACYDFRTRETLVDEKFVAQIGEKAGISPEEALEGIFIHEIGHYMVFPRTLGTLILAGKMASDFFSKEGSDMAGFIVQTYADMCTDTASVLEEQRTEPIIRLRSGLQEVKEDKLNHGVRQVMLSYLLHQAGREHQLDDELKPFFERMRGIDFLGQDIEKMRQGIFTFGNIIVDMVKSHGQRGLPGGESGGGSGLKGSGPADSDIKQILENATPQEIKEALREIAGKVNKGEFDKVREWMKEQGGQLPSMPPMITIGTSEGNLPVDQDIVQYYKDLASHHPLIVTKKLLETESSIRSWSDVKKWRPGDDPALALPGSSGGMLLPGITKSIRIAEVPIRTTDYDVPHLLIVIDSSGSMPHPARNKSYAVLGGYCAALSYNVQGAHVGVVNFSGSSFYLPYTRELDHALGAISAFQGGGTVVDVDMVRKMMGPEMAELYKHHPERDMGRIGREFMKKELSIGIGEEVFKAESIDVLMFTDGGIANLDEVLAMFSERAELNRATIALTHGFSQELAEIKDDRITIHSIDDVKDIPKLVLREVSRNFSSKLAQLERLMG